MYCNPPCAVKRNLGGEPSTKLQDRSLFSLAESFHKISLVSSPVLFPTKHSSLRADCWKSIWCAEPRYISDATSDGTPACIRFSPFSVKVASSMTFGWRSMRTESRYIPDGSHVRTVAAPFDETPALNLGAEIDFAIGQRMNRSSVGRSAPSTLLSSSPIEASR